MIRQSVCNCCGLPFDDVDYDSSKVIIQILKNLFLDRYEVFIFNKNKFHLLDEYYQFLACVDVKPYIPFSDNNQFNASIKDAYHEKYENIRANVTLGMIDKIQNKILDIVIHSDMSKKIGDIFKMDKEFDVSFYTDNIDNNTVHNVA